MCALASLLGLHAADLEEEEIEAGAEDTDLLSRGPYEFQFRVDDPETFNKYEVGEMMKINGPLKLTQKYNLDPGIRRPGHRARQLQN